MKKFLAILAALTTLTGAATAFGFYLDRPAWHSELKAVEQRLISEIAEVAGLSLPALLLQKESRLWAVQREMRKLERDGLPVPRHLINERNLPIRQIKRLRKKIG